MTDNQLVSAFSAGALFMLGMDYLVFPLVARVWTIWIRARGSGDR